MQMLDPIPGESFAKSEFSEVYLRPGRNARRAEIVHKVYEEPAVAAWQAALEATKTYGTKRGNKGTPNRTFTERGA